jgi:signal peptidase II
VMGGLLGNLYDRLGLPVHLFPGSDVQAGEPVHAVRDWILMQWSDQLRWPNFNVADVLLVCGAISLVLHAALFPQVAHESPDVADDVRQLG